MTPSDAHILMRYPFLLSFPVRQMMFFLVGVCGVLLNSKLVGLCPGSKPLPARESCNYPQPDVHITILGLPFLLVMPSVYMRTQ